MKSIPSRGLQDIHTMSERISDTDNPQRKYLALAMLELERARRNQEKQSANQRVANIDQRLAEITAEQTELLAAAKTELNTSTQAERRGQAADSNSPSGRGFTLAY
jgi:cytochrome c-type biogenesis protein CcmH/NrfG